MPNAKILTSLSYSVLRYLLLTTRCFDVDTVHAVYPSHLVLIGCGSDINGNKDNKNNMQFLTNEALFFTL